MNHRNAYQDYRAPAFYMITMTALNHRPLFATCADNRSLLNKDGWLVHNLWHAMTRTYPEVATSTLVIMPEHLHGIVRVRARMKQGVGVPLRAFKSQVTSSLRKQYENPNLSIWNPGYHDMCVWRRGALKAYTRYICDNPRRYCLRKAHPDLFTRVDHLRHSRLPPGQSWNGYGNCFLLDRPERIDLRVSRRATPADIARLRDEILQQASQGAVVVSPFISPGEKTVASAILDARHGDVILMKTDGFKERYKPSGRYFDLCAQGRLLILTPYPNHSKPAELTREQCNAMNAWCNHIARAEG